jgi:glycosyltransferase involved in cell wall biosynthesis
MVSRFGWIKGPDIFAQTAAKVLSTRSGIYFVMVGGGPMLGEIQDLAAQLKLGDKCIFVPAQRDIRPLLSTFDIAVLSSRSEGFSNSLLEYMSSGRAIVATNVGGNSEALSDAGLLVPSEDPDALARAINTLIDNPEQRQALGKKARLRAQNLFDVQKAQVRVQEYVAALAGSSSREPNTATSQRENANSATGK